MEVDTDMIDGGRADTVRRLFVVLPVVDGGGNDEPECCVDMDEGVGSADESLIGAKPTEGGDALNTV